MNAVDNILMWAKTRPAWTTECLTRIMGKGALDETDITDLADVCQASHGLKDATSSPAVILQAVEQPADSSNAPIRLESVTHHRGVNALKDEQTLSFGPALTLVFGENAVGKSGYTRILKNACRSRSPEKEILGNVLGSTAPLKAQASIRFSVGDVTSAFAWTPTAPPSAALAAINVFDTHSAPVYLKDKTDVAFRPFGLDLLDVLAQAADRVRKRLELEASALQAHPFVPPPLPIGTKAQLMVNSLTSLTSVDTIRALATLTPGERERLQTLQQLKQDSLVRDTKQRAQDLTLKSKLIGIVSEHVALAGERVTAAAAERLRTHRDRVVQAQLAADDARASALGDDVILGTGGALWATMWRAAVLFANDSKDRHFLDSATKSATCPLCQQAIGKDAAVRLKHFREFVSAATQRELEAAHEALAKEQSLVVSATRPSADLDVALTQIELEDESLAIATRSFLASAQHFGERVATNDVELPWVADDLVPLQRLGALAALLNERSKALGIGVTMTAAEASELAELESRDLLKTSLPIVEHEIERKRRLAAFNLCVNDASTGPITRKSSELTKTLVTQQLHAAFHAELLDLGFDHVTIELKAAGGAKGALMHQIVFPDAPGVAVLKVLSEGEARTLSLAAFLAELSTAANKAPIIFDDPVSSLDHAWRQKIAARLTKESLARQVVVFTHDILFLRLLMDEAERIGAPVKHQHLSRAGQAGVSSDQQPWIAMRVKQRIGMLKQWQQAAKGTWKSEGKEAYEDRARFVFAKLREAWEQAVSEILLNDVIERYRPSIETQKVQHLHDITADDCKVIDAHMTDCSRWMVGHDAAAAEVAPLPDPDHLLKCVEALENFVDAIRKRRK